MKCQHCDIEMVYIYGVSMGDPYAMEFRGATGKKIWNTARPYVLSEMWNSQSDRASN